LPLTWIVTDPLCARVRAEVCCAGAGPAVMTPLLAALLLLLLAPDAPVGPEVMSDAETCWTNGSLPAKWLNE